MSIKYIKGEKSATPIDIIIPSASHGYRLKSYGNRSMIVIKNNTTVLDYQLKIIKKKFPVSNIILVCGFEADRLMNYAPKHVITIENEKYDTTNVVRSIGIGLRATQNDVLIIYGDVVFNKQCLDVIDLNKSCIVTGNNIMPNSQVGCTVSGNHNVQNLMYDLDNKWGQISFFKNKELKMLKEIAWDRDNDKMLGFEVINKIIGQGGKIKSCFGPKTEAIDIDGLKDLDRAKAMV